MTRKNRRSEPISQSLGAECDLFERYAGLGTENITLDDLTWFGNGKEPSKREIAINALALELARRIPGVNKGHKKSINAEQERAHQIAAALRGRPKRGRPERSLTVLMQRIGRRCAHAYHLGSDKIALYKIIREEVLQDRPELQSDPSLNNAISAVHHAFKRREDYWIRSGTGGGADDARELRILLDAALKSLEDLGLFDGD